MTQDNISQNDKNDHLKPTQEMSYFERNFLGVPLKKIHTLVPGLIFLTLLAFLSIFLSNFIGITLLGYTKSPISAVMIILLFGMLINNLIKLPEALNPGFKFAVKKILRLGIILLGIRMSIFAVFELGAIGVPIVIGCILSALVITSFFNKMLHQPKRLGTLIAVGTSICGVSAIVAASPAINANEEETAYAVSVITVFGLIAVITYPIIAYFLFGGNPIKAGLWLGTSIHDTSQVTGAAIVFSDMWDLPVALDVAIVTKLVRNVLMILVIPLMAFYYTKMNEKEDVTSDSRDKKIKPKTNILKIFPMFVIGFLIMACIRSIGDAGINSSNLAFFCIEGTSWDNFVGTTTEWATILFVVALGGVGLTTRFSKFKDLGIKPFLVGLSAALTIGLISFVLISLIGGFIVI